MGPRSSSKLQHFGDHHRAVRLLRVSLSRNSHVSACGPVVVVGFFFIIVLNSIVAVAPG